jgi:hypothetical protein
VYDRPLSGYVRELWAADLAVTAVEEPDGSEGFRAKSPQREGIRKVPLCLVIEARKGSFDSALATRPGP